MEDGDTDELRFQRGQASAEQLQAVVDETLSELRADAQRNGDSADSGGELQQLAALQVTVSEGASGVEPILTMIILTVAGSAGKQLANKLWEQVLWPRVKRKLGGRAVGEREG